MTMTFLPAPAPAAILALSRPEIDAGDIQHALASLRQLDATAQSAPTYRGALEVTVLGFEDDPRELHQIPEVRRFVEALTRSWPFWFYFCSKRTETLRVLMLCMIDTHVLPSRGGKVAVTFDRVELVGVVRRLMIAGNELYERLELDEADNEALTEEILAYIEPLTGDEQRA